MATTPASTQKAPKTEKKFVAPAATTKAPAPQTTTPKTTSPVTLSDKYNALSDDKKNKIAIGGIAVIGLVISVGAYMIFRRK